MVDACLGAVAAVACDRLAAVVRVRPALIPHRSAGVAVAGRAHVGRFIVVVSAWQIPAYYDGPSSPPLNWIAVCRTTANPLALCPDNLGVMPRS